jgi:hypothetical protein
MQYTDVSKEPAAAIFEGKKSMSEKHPTRNKQQRTSTGLYGVTLILLTVAVLKIHHRGRTI